MVKDLKFSDIPGKFLFCLNDGCGRADSCLRRQTAHLVPADKKNFLVVNPNYANQGGGCDEYLSDTPVREAFGMNHLYDAVPYSEVPKVRNTLVLALGKKKYYQLYREEIGFTPEMQDTVRRVFRMHGITAEPQWDSCRDVTIWSNPSVK